MAIIQMKKLCVVTPKGLGSEVLRILYGFGCVEISSGESAISAYQDVLRFRPVESSAGEQGEAIWRAVSALNKLTDYSKGLLTPKPTLDEGAFLQSGVIADACAIAEVINACVSRMDAANAESAALTRELDAYLDWVGLDMPLDYDSPSVGALFGLVSEKSTYEDFAAALGERVPDCIPVLAGTARSKHHIAILYYKPSLAQLMEGLSGLGFTPVSFPAKSGSPAEIAASLQGRIGAAQETVKTNTDQILGYDQERQVLERGYDAATILASKDKLLSSIGTTEYTEVFTGWLGAESEEAVTKALTDAGCAVFTSDPEEGDDVPTAMKNGKLAEPFDAITQMYGLPRYDSIIDPNPVMVPFYVIFFGFMVCDTGYGILMTIFTHLALKMIKPTGTMKKMLTLFYYCGYGTILAGVLTGSWFGDAVAAFTGVFLGKTYAIPPIMFDPLSNPVWMLGVALGMGLIHIMAGMGVSGYRQYKEGDLFGAIIDVGSWYLIFIGIGLLVLGLFAGQVMIGIGVLMLLLFAGREKKGFFGKVTGGLGAIYGILGYMSDLLSYSRIMAIGLSGAVVAQVFNSIGAMMADMVGQPVIGFILFVVIFAIGHVFNIAIGALGAYVHTSRLQYIEYFSKFYREGGRPFRPLGYYTKFTQIIKED
ncbi:MAG: V-type ATP synthase subunit I [Clostridiales bacterium]|nr:V-type ATP synthase subunit I [Clostridiales bacterium]